MKVSRFLILLAVPVGGLFLFFVALQLWFLSFKVSDPAKAESILQEAVSRLRARDKMALDPAQNVLLTHKEMFYPRQYPKGDELAVPFKAFTEYSGPAQARVIDYAQESETQQFKTALAEYEKNLPVLRKLLASPNLLWESHYDQGADAPVPSFLLMRGIAQNLAGYTDYQISLGKGQEALPDALLNRAAGGKYAQGGTLIVCMIGVAIHDIGAGALIRLVMSGQLEPAQYQEIISAQKDNLLTPKVLLDRLDEEFAFQMICIDHLKSGKYGKSVDLASWPVYVPGFLERERRIIQETYLKDRAVFEVFGDLPDHHGEYLQRDLERAKAPIASVLYPNYEKAYLTYKSSMSRDNAIVIMAALQLYKLKNERYPGKLEELVPRQLAELPKDLLSPDGKFVYKPENGSFTLRSGYTGTTLEKSSERLTFYPDKGY